MASQLAHSSDALHDHWPSPSEWILRICFAIRCFGGDAYLWNPMERDSDLFGVMFFDWQWPESTSLHLENWAVTIMVVAGLWVVANPLIARYRSAGDPSKNELRLERLLLALAVCWELALALAITWRGGRFFSQITVASHGLRIAVPLALLLNHRSVPMQHRPGGFAVGHGADVWGTRLESLAGVARIHVDDPGRLASHVRPDV